jgi:hypothetical protein
MANRAPPPTDPEIPDLDLDFAPGAGRTSKAMPSGATAGFPAAKNDALSFDASLDDDFLGPGLNSAAPSRQSVRSRPATNDSFSFDAGLDDDFLGSDLDLASGSDDTRSPKWQTDGQSQVVKDRRWPTGTTPEPGSAQIGPEQVQPLVGWGPAPTSWWQTPLYAYLVFLGRRDLSRQLEPITRELRQVETRRDDCLSTLASSLREKLVDDPSFHGALQPVQASEVVHHQASSQLQQVETSSANELQSLDRAIQAAQTRLAELESELRAAQAALQDAELNLKREQARYQRLGIERRNIEQADTGSETAAARVAEISQQAEALLPQIESARLLDQSRRAAMTVAQRSIEEKQSELGQLTRRKSVLNRSYTSQVNQASAAMSGASLQQRRALADLGRAVLQARGRTPVDESTLDELVRYDDAIATLWMREQVYLSALESYDRHAVRRGLLLAGTFLILFIGSFVWRLLS